MKVSELFTSANDAITVKRVLGELVVPVLRREFAVVRAPRTPDAPVHPRVSTGLPVVAAAGAPVVGPATTRRGRRARAVASG